MCVGKRATDLFLCRKSTLTPRPQNTCNAIAICSFKFGIQMWYALVTQRTLDTKLIFQFSFEINIRWRMIISLLSMFSKKDVNVWQTNLLKRLSWSVISVFDLVLPDLHQTNIGTADKAWDMRARLSKLTDAIHCLIYPQRRVQTHSKWTLNWCEFMDLEMYGIIESDK